MGSPPANTTKTTQIPTQCICQTNCLNPTKSPAFPYATASLTKSSQIKPNRQNKKKKKKKAQNRAITQTPKAQPQNHTSFPASSDPRKKSQKFNTFPKQQQFHPKFQSKSQHDRNRHNSSHQTKFDKKRSKTKSSHQAPK